MQRLGTVEELQLSTSVSCPQLGSDRSPCGPGRSPSATSPLHLCARPLPVTGGKGGGGTLPWLFSHAMARFSNQTPRPWGGKFSLAP